MFKINQRVKIRIEKHTSFCFFGNIIMVFADSFFVKTDAGNIINFWKRENPDQVCESITTHKYSVEIV